jgi:thymidine kinase
MTLEIYVGPMFSGKTTRMISMFSSNQRSDKVVIDYDLSRVKGSVTIDNLINHNEFELSHVYKACSFDDLSKETSYSANIISSYEHLLHANHIYINECQFFPDLKVFVLECLRKNKCVYLYGLDGDYKQELFGQTAELIPYCTYIEKIKGTCDACNERSVISYRTTNDKELYLPDSDSYIPLCLRCLQSTNKLEVPI